MTQNDASLHELAGAIVAGAEVDWASAESSAADESIRQVVRELKVIAGIAGVHRSELRSSEDPRTPSEKESLSDPQGKSWGPLRLLEKIGHGAYGEVFRAWDTRLDREVALKLLHAGCASGVRATSSIIHEGRLLARVRHPNVVTIYGAEQIDDRVGLWMELVRGRTLDQVLKEGAPFSAAETIRIGAEICRALSAVHGAGLLHRDIKGHNVMLADDGRVVVMDFGTGREMEAAASTDLAGTPLYLAPEVLLGQPATIQSDIYSLGVLLFHVVSRSYPVQASTTKDLRLAHERNARVALHTVHPDMPARLARVIERAIDPSPQRRYQNADALADELTAVGRGSGRIPLVYAGVAAAAIVLVSWLAFAIAKKQSSDATLPHTTSPSTTRVPTPTAGRPVVAVLPFKNLGDGADSEVFADGLTYEIHRNLAVIEGLDVRSSMSSFAFKDKPRNLTDVGRQLGAAFVLEGSIFRSAGTIRVSARLARVSDGTTLWAGKFDRGIGEVFAIQDEISLAIVNALRLKLGRGQRRYETDTEVYYRFLRASGLQSRHHPEDSSRAAAMFEAIVARAPAFAPAWAGLASAAADATRHQPREEMPAVDPRMEPAALRAIQLDPLLAEAHAAMGNVYGRNRDWTNAQKSFVTAMDLNPSLTTTYTDFVLSTLMPMGKTAESLRRLEDAHRVDPLSLDVRRLLAQVQVNAGRHADAIESARWVLARDPKFPYAEVFLGRALLFAGRPNEALSCFENSSSEGNWGYVGYLYAVTGRRDEAEALAAKHPDAAARQMLIYAGLGDKDRAFEALERTAAVHWWRAATWMIRPEMAVLRGDPRVDALRRKLGLPPFEDAR